MSLLWTQPLWYHTWYVVPTVFTPESAPDHNGPRLEDAAYCCEATYQKQGKHLCIGKSDAERWSFRVVLEWWCANQEKIDAGGHRPPAFYMSDLLKRCIQYLLLQLVRIMICTRFVTAALGNCFCAGHHEGFTKRAERSCGARFNCVLTLRVV